MRPSDLVIVDLSEAPFSPENWPIWTDEMDRKVLPVLFGSTAGQFRDNVTIRFSLMGIPTLGTAVFHVMEGNPRTWHMRVVIFPIKGDKPHAATFQFHFPGEDALDFEGRRKMHPRLPVTKEFHGVYRSQSEIQDAVAVYARRIDQEAEQIYSQAVAANSAFQNEMFENPEKAVTKLAARAALLSQKATVPKIRSQNEPHLNEKWRALVKFDEDIAKAADTLRPFGDQWIAELGRGYLRWVRTSDIFLISLRSWSRKQSRKKNDCAWQQRKRRNDYGVLGLPRPMTGSRAVKLVWPFFAARKTRDTF